MSPDISTIQACKYALKTNLGIRPNEKVLVITDEKKRHIGKAFERAALQFTRKVELIEIAIPKFNGQEPPDFVDQKMQSADVVLMPLCKSLSWTQARMNATRKGARIASMPRINEDIILRTFPIDYEPIKSRVNKLCDLLDSTHEIRVTTALGADIRIGVRGRKGRGRNSGIYRKKGAWGNLPCGEAFIAPVEGTTMGVYMVDASHAGLDRVTEPIKITVERGLAVKFEGGSQAGQLDAMLLEVGDPNAYNIAEFGIGCNDKAEIVGITLEDEKVLGTCHIALGRNSFFGGLIDVGVHVDGVIKSPTIFFDQKKIMESGRLLI